MAQFLDRQGALVGVREIVVMRTEWLAELDRHVGDEDAMLVPELVDALLAGGEEVVDVVDKKHTFTRVIRVPPAAEEHEKSAARTREEIAEPVFGDDFEAGNLRRVERG